MTTATPPVLLRTREEIQRYAESIVADDLASAPPSLRPSVEIGPHPLLGFSLNLSMPEDAAGTFVVSRPLPSGSALTPDQVSMTFWRAYSVALQALTSHEEHGDAIANQSPGA